MIETGAGAGSDETMIVLFIVNRPGSVSPDPIIIISLIICIIKPASNPEVRIMKSYVNLFRNYGNFSGFLKRKPFWTAVLIHLLILIIPLIPGVLYLAGKSSLLPSALDLADGNSWISKVYVPWVLPILCFYFLLTRIPLLAASVRRLHTLPRKGWWLLIGLIPVVGWFIVFIWLLQKGNYENFEKRMNVIAPSLLKIAEKPQKGGWFFVVFALLAVGGFFLNRQLRQSGSVTEAFQDIRSSLPSDWESLKFWEKNDKKAAPAEDAGSLETEIPDAAPEIPTETPLPTEEPLPTPTMTEIPIVYLRPAEGKPLTDRKDGKEILSAGEDIFASKYAVTVSDFRACVRDGVCEMPAELNTLAYQGAVPKAGQALDSENDASELPMVFVSKDDASAYCEWAGMRLPSASEWKEAAKSPEATEYTAENANCIGTDRTEFIKSGNQIAQTVPVSAFEDSASDYGLVQMAGNVWEWTSDADDKGLSSLALGGAWNSYPANLGPDAELLTLSGYAAGNIGFRCFVDAADVTDENFEGGEPVPEITAETVDVEEADVIEADVEEADVEAAGIEAEEIGEELPEAETESASDQEIRARDNAPMVLIPGGTFTMGAANGAIDERPVHDVTLSPYWIDIYEISNAQYALCVADSGCTEPREAKSFRQAEYYGNPEFDNYPVIYVDWNQAAEYCEWAGARLLTEAEWEYAAKGPDGNAFPWGSTFDAKKLNYSGSGTYDTAAVDATPLDVSQFGVYNLGGNVTEWVQDRYQENWYSVTDQPTDPTGPENGRYYVIRGSSSQFGENNARTADRNFAQGTSYNLDRGFRCARSAE